VLCALCKKNPASVLIKQIVDNQVSEAHLCLSCAQTQAQETAAPAIQGLLELLGGAVPPRPAPAARCAACGLRWSDFRKTGILGCSGCYDSFAAPLKAVVLEVQGTARHGGKVPAGARAALEGRLDDALRREDYEEAARLRDAMRRRGKAR
jgi:protein arginine kinase activator